MNDIKIALYGQFENDTKFDFTFPDEFNPALNRPEDYWLRNVGDPRDAREFERAQRIYALWKSADGNYYASIVRNMNDTRMGYIMLMLFVGHRVPTNGHSLINAMGVLEQKLIGEGLRDRQAVAQILQQLPCELMPDNILPAPNVVKSRIKAFRTFGNENELADIFLYPNQIEYEQFHRVLLVPREAVTQMPINYQELNFPIRHSYNVECPQGVRVNRITVSDGDILDIVYSKPTYADTTVHERVLPMGSQFFSINGPRLIVKSADEANVQFVRRAKLDIRSAKTRQQLTNILINGTRVTGTEAIIGEGDEIDWVISAPGYREERVKRSINAVIQGGYLISVLLKPEDKDINIIARCEGMLAEGHVSISVDDPLYRYLTDKHNYEVRIDRKASAAAVTVTGSKGVKPAAAKKDNGMMRMLIAALVGILFGLIIGLAINFIFSSANSEEPPLVTVTEPDDDSDNDDAQPSPKQMDAEAQQRRAEQDRLEQSDLVYLKQANIWKPDSIKSDLYRGLYTLIENANLREVVGHPYISTERPNGYWQKIVERVNTVLASNNDNKISKCRDAFLRFTENGSCDLSKLNDAILVIITPQPSTPTGSNPRSGNNGGNAVTRQGGNNNAGQGGNNAGQGGDNNAGQGQPSGSERHRAF